MGVKKVGGISDGAGWKVHRRGSQEALASRRASKGKIGCAHLRTMSAASPACPTLQLETEKVVSTIGPFHRTWVYFAAEGITLTSRLVTDSDPKYHMTAFKQSARGVVARHQQIPLYTSRRRGEGRVLPAVPGRGMSLRPPCKST